MKKPFAYLAFALLLTANCLLQTACHFNPDMQTPGESYLQGEWQQDSVTMQKQLVSYSLYNLKFNCDSFFVAIKTISKANTGADSCTKNGQWTEYVKGVYEQRNDTLHVRGLFCNADYSYKDPSGCFRSGVYEERFKIIKKTDSLVQFNPTSSVIAINTRLVKRNSCIPKPL
ncbi:MULTISPECIES: fumarate hydratase [unclassified Mucilaginibacter]|uniref:fumarate hydratase n=1 Tax=unclassified Mucilaginibacter TaxID=2617802 RepID=UPI002AC8D269|nr:MULTISPECIES: fumarate hydratase [unclassified Mucilaginibacter]MEB0280772.1 fumarate hydratase [Mucilaginibacter sp. 10B2]MEB0302125.1 fumarate hydratase [Mucilaginibacter sp. 5C4]WPX24315.1 fumarate hydratase [Mucilaginibacter sp. 5C4]